MLVKTLLPIFKFSQTVQHLHLHPTFSYRYKNAIPGEACEHSGTPLSIDCGEKVISIVHAAYGVYSNDNTCGVSYGGDCLSATSHQVQQLFLTTRINLTASAVSAIMCTALFPSRYFGQITLLNESESMYST